MNQELLEKPILIYYNIRGNAQIIRSVLREIGVEFHEIFVTKEGYLHPDIIQKYGIQLDKLPYLVHKGHAITDVFPIIKYLCIYFNRGDLLGRTVDDSIKIAEILVKYSKERNNILATLMQGLREILDKKLGDSALLKLAGVLASIVAKNKYCQATEKMFIKTGKFLCGYLTILDFIYYQKCFYYVNMLTVKFPPKGEISTQYVNFYEQTPFFQKNKEFLNQYQIFMQELDTNMNDLMHKMWIGDHKFLAD